MLWSTVSTTRTRPEQVAPMPPWGFRVTCHANRALPPRGSIEVQLGLNGGARLTGRSGADSRSGESSLFSLVSCPNGAPHTSLGQRPRKSAPHASCPEGAPHNLCENGLNAGPMLSPFRARSMVSPYPGRLPQSGICPGLVCRRAFSAQDPDHHLRRMRVCRARHERRHHSSCSGLILGELCTERGPSHPHTHGQAGQESSSRP